MYTSVYITLMAFSLIALIYQYLSTINDRSGIETPKPPPSAALAGKSYMPATAAENSMAKPALSSSLFFNKPAGKKFSRHLTSFQTHMHICTIIYVCTNAYTSTYADTLIRTHSLVTRAHEHTNTHSLQIYMHVHTCTHKHNFVFIQTHRRCIT